MPPEEKDSIVLQEPTRKSISVFGAACVNDGRLVTKFSKPFNGVTFQEYLEQLLNHKKDRLEMHIILDNSKYHHAKLLNPQIGGLFIIFWVEKPQKVQSKQRKAAPLCPICGSKTMQWS